MHLKNSSFFSALLITFILISCGGGVSGENGDDPFGSDNNQNDEYELTVSVLNAQCELVSEASFVAGETLCVQAKLSHSNSSISGKIITFSSELGELSTASKLTNANGLAEIFLSSDTGIIGASTLSAEFESVIVDINYEFLTPNVENIGSPVINLVLLKNGQATNRFSSNEQVLLQATLLDQEGNGLPDQIVSFTAGRGLLNTNDALTNSQGVADVILSASDTELGAATATANVTYNETDLVNQLNFEIQPVDHIPQQSIRAGRIDQDGDFIEGEIGMSVAGDDAEISAGATLGLSVVLIDENGQRVLTQTPISFTSTCVATGAATIDEVVNTINGIAQTTYEDISCAGSNGNIDTVVASVVINNSTVSLTRPITIQAESIGSIGFVSAQPSEIVLQGTGGQNSQTISTLVFNVTGALGNPLSQQEVTFSLNTAAGGLSLSPESGITNSQGQVSTRVTSGSVPTSVRVTAEITTDTDDVIRTQSDLLSVNTGLPDQNSMSLAISNFNPEAHNIDGETVSVVARLADTFNNPVPDGTSVSFTSEGGTIEPSCITENGTCSVVWTSANPRVDDHHITILATAIGHETLLDANGNNIFDDMDGGALTAPVGSEQTGFIDMSEAWRDDNDDGKRDPAEIFLDFDNDQEYDGPDGLFNGPQCQSDTLCGEGIHQTLHVRQSAFMTMSSSWANWSVYQGETLVFNDSDSTKVLQVENGNTEEIYLVFTDTAGRVMPSGTLVGILDSENQVDNVIFTVPNRTKFSENELGHKVRLIQIDNSLGDVSNLALSYVIESPSGKRTLIEFIVNE
ncbi:Ig-like domain-containing protein [Paraglaciecola sp.]|uniref:Ig-like domain-containing protein n=1 Tax=Paraglaciecola sp. TaxID=1920173 RepID=UPI003EFAA424